MRHWALRVTLVSAVFGLLGFMYEYWLPKFESLLLLEVERLTKKHSPVRVWAHQLHFHLVPLGIEMRDVRLLAQEPFDRYLAPAQLKSVRANLAILPLLRGEFRLSSLKLERSEINLFLREELFKGSSQPTRVDFDLIYRLPIDELILEDLILQARIEPQNAVIRINPLNLILENRFRSLYVDLSAPQILAKPSGPQRPVELQLELRGLVESKEAQISALKIRAERGFLVASGRFNGDFGAGQIDSGSLNTRLKMSFADLNLWDSLLRESPTLPVLEGEGEADIGVEVANNRLSAATASIKTSGLHIGKFIVGDLATSFSTNFKEIKSELLTVQNSSGKAELRSIHIPLEPAPGLSAQVKADNLDLRTFLDNLNVHGVPVELPVSGDLNCVGEWNKKRELNCRGTISSPRLRVYSGKKNSTIVAGRNLRVQGGVKVTTKQVEYEATLEVGKSSKANSKGVIHYDKGFQIEYETPGLAFTDVDNLANLKFEGTAALKGNTIGTSKWATIDMDVNAKDFWLEDYPLGELTGKLRYKAGHLSFPGIQGQYQVTRFSGDMDINLIDDRLKVKALIPFVELKDIQSMFQRKVSLPIEAAGTGTGYLEAEGPFRFRDMSYMLKSTFYRGQVAGESFDQLNFNVRSQNGLVQSERIYMTKGKGSIEMKGQITPQGEIDSVVVGRSLRLEQSENVNALGFDVQGLADTTVLIRGQLPHPGVELNGRFSRMVLADQPAEDSVFKLSFRSDRLEGSGQFLGTKVIGDFIIPYNDEAPFLFRAKTHSWDFTTLFSLISKSARQLDFETSVSLSMNLQAPRGGLWASSGQIKVDEFKIRKGSTVMAAEKPMVLVAKDGVLNSKNCSVSSGDSYLKLEVNDLSRNRFNASVNGKLDLSLMGLFTPFIADLRGNMALSVDLRGQLQEPKLSGSAYLDKGYAKFVDFVHPFSNVRADVLFNDNQILLNSVRAELGGGKLSGEGRITLTPQAKTVDVRGNFSDVRINVPEGFKTQGNGTVAIRGTQFPYLMRIDYAVNAGEVTYEIGADSGGASSVKASSYLPRFLHQEAFHPFSFDLDVDVSKGVIINNSMAQALVTGKVKALGTPDRLALTGTLTPQPGGKVFFKDVPFDIASAYFEYDGSPPPKPRIYLTANARVSESVQDEQQRTSEHQFDVNLLVQGRGPNPQIILTSQPPLSQREIVSLLALGVTSSALDERRSSDAQVANTSTAVTTAILQKAGGKRLKDTFGVDFKVSSSQPTPDNTSTPKVTLSKQWTPKFGASASSTLAANPTNNVKLEYKMNKNVSVVGTWDGKETLPEQQVTTPNVFGLDLEYKVQFK
ncbi:MAG: translocation/assembly module TamB domain-containing protein [Bdellovibrionales bacterium]